MTFINLYSKSIDLWISYIDFVYTKSNKKEIKEASNVYWRAMKHLNTDLVDLFTQKFCLFKINLNDKDKQLSPAANYDIEMD